MSTMKWTDEAIENGLQYCRRFDQAGQSDNTSQQLKRALLELKRMRACITIIGCGTEDEWARLRLARCLSGDPAPSEEQAKS